MKRMMNIFLVFMLISSWAYASFDEHKQKFINKYKNSKFYMKERIINTISCPDTDYIPKIEDAGKVFYENGTKYQLLHNGVKVLAGKYYGEWICDIIEALKGHHEPQEEKAFYEVLKYISPKAKMLELGCYWAYYSLWFWKEIPQAELYLMEPDENNINIGKENFKINGAKGHFFLAFNGYKRPNNCPHAKMIQIDDFMRSNNIDYLNILHSDIQHAEYEMLLGAKESILSNKIGFLFISTHNTDKNHYRCKDLIISYGYEIICEHTPSQSCSEDGLIVAKSRYIKGPNKIEVSK